MAVSFSLADPGIFLLVACVDVRRAAGPAGAGSLGNRRGKDDY